MAEGQLALKILPTVFLILSVACPALLGRQWQTTDGRKFEGEIVKCTRTTLSILDAKRNRINIELDRLAPKDLEFLKKNYPEFFKDTNSHLRDTSAAISKWPIIKVDKTAIAFRWDISASKFHTKHYSFDMKKRLEKDVAHDLAARCETAYESVMQIPFIDEKFKRKSSNLNKKSEKFLIEIANIKEKNIAGIYMYNASSTSGVLYSEFVRVEPKFLAKNDKSKNVTENMYLPAGTLAHELAHQILAFAGGTIAIKEGLSDFIFYGMCNNFGVCRFDMYESLLRHKGYFERGKGKSKISVLPLREFLTMRKAEFYSQKNVANNYTAASLFFIYFYRNDPKTLKKFLDKALNEKDYVPSEISSIKRCMDAFEILLNGKSQAELENKICAYYAKFGIAIEFKNQKKR